MRCTDRLPPDRIVTVATPDYTVTPAGADYADPRRQHDGIVAVNATMARASEVRSSRSWTVRPVAPATDDGSLVADDGLHPSGAQDALW